MATVMATGNADMENAAVDLVNPRPDANVLMIGCGPGVGVVAAARRASNGMVIGLDPSEVMVERTRARCRRARQAEEDTRSGGQVGSAEVPSLFGATRSPYSDDELDEGRLLESLMRALRARASRRPMDLRS